MRHKHADLMCAYANDTSLRFEYRFGNSDWLDCSVRFGPEWNEAYEYRIKPTPKPDVVKSGCAFLNSVGCTEFNKWGDEPWKTDNLRLTFDGETGKLKSAEVL